jgi:hypothetical protein
MKIIQLNDEEIDNRSWHFELGKDFEYGIEFYNIIGELKCAKI